VIDEPYSDVAFTLLELKLDFIFLLYFLFCFGEEFEISIKLAKLKIINFTMRNIKEQETERL